MDDTERNEYKIIMQKCRQKKKIIKSYFSEERKGRLRERMAFAALKFWSMRRFCSALRSEEDENEDEDEDEDEDDDDNRWREGRNAGDGSLSFFKVSMAMQSRTRP